MLWAVGQNSFFMKIIVTGAAGFVGRNLVENLRTRLPAAEVTGVTRASFTEVSEGRSLEADFVFHLAGVNRPQDPAEFDTGNREATARLCARLEQSGSKPVFVLTSSIQAEVDNPYGRSKRAAEIAVADWVNRSGSTAVVFRLPNIFGKWCRPNYNSVVATFCHNVAHGLPIQISDTAKALTLVYIDDVVAALLACIDNRPPAGVTTREVPVSHTTTLGTLADLIRSFRSSRETLLLPDFADPLVRKLYATYLSYLPPAEFSYPLLQRSDQRGSLAEFLKSATFGQIFLSRTKPGISRGNHYHHTKTEKFMVVEGEAIIRFRRIGTEAVVEHRVAGTDFKVVDIPPGYTHSIENVGRGELVTLFWASEIFDPNMPDTFMLQVANPQGGETPCA